MLNSPESVTTAPSGAMTKKGRPATKPERIEQIPGQADRLRRLRDAYGYNTTTAFAVFLGIPITTYSSFENGAPLSRGAAFTIVQKLAGITLDWLYFGKPDGLPLDVARRLGLLDPPSGKRKS
jgi:hypothetical protein